MAQVAVGLAGFVVLWTAVESIRATNKNLELSSQNLALQKSTQLSERFAAAVNLLNEEGHSSSNDSIADAGAIARVGGVFGLDRIVESEPAYLEPTLHVLAAMVQREAPRSLTDSPRGLSEMSVGWRRIADLSENYPETGRQMPTVPQRSQEDSYRFRPCEWLDAHPEVRPYLPGSDHENLAPDIAAALTVIGQLGRLINSKGPAWADVSTKLTRNIDLSQAKLCIAYLNGGKLMGAWFRDSDLRGAILDDADLTNAGLVAVNLTGGHLRRARLVDSNLKEAFLNQADLSFADLSGADLAEAKLDDANLSGANLQDANNLTQHQLDRACGSSTTKLPNDLVIADCRERTNSMWRS
jgi:Pentapeptide repeats (8 copies)